MFMLLTAFSNGCTALTGVEAVSNGVPAFRPPESKNAAQTLVAMAVMSITMFIGITLLAHAYAIVPSDAETVVSQIARATFGGRGWPYYLVQASTMAILVLAANTAYADFPRLSSILARDRFLPRQFMNQGDRLAFSNGILILSVLASVLLVVFAGDTHALIPLYMIGVFVSFTLSQAGMVLHWRALRGAGLAHERRDQRVRRDCHRNRARDCGDDEGGRGRVDHHRDDSSAGDDLRDHQASLRSGRRDLSLSGWSPDTQGSHVVIVPIGGIQRAVVKALRYARTLSNDVRAVYVDIDPAATESVRQLWPQWGQQVELVVLESPFRSLMEPLLEYIEDVQCKNPDGFVTVVLPEFVPRSVLAAPAAQPARAPHQRCAALQAQHRRDERAVSPRVASRSRARAGAIVVERPGPVL